MTRKFHACALALSMVTPLAAALAAGTAPADATTKVAAAIANRG